MKRFNWQIGLGIGLLALSTFFYIFHYLIFRDAHHIFLYLIGDIAFVFIEVLLVTLIINGLLSEREKLSKFKKLNMVIGAFFCEAGTDLLKSFSDYDLAPGKIRKELKVSSNWSDLDFERVSKQIKNLDYEIDSRKGNLEHLKCFLSEKRDFFLRLLENQNLLEHESFSELLLAVSHLAEELLHRTDVMHLHENDYNHISWDMQRAYAHLVSEWLAYMNHLRLYYPYLFSLAMRTNPFDPDASVEIE